MMIIRLTMIAALCFLSIGCDTAGETVDTSCTRTTITNSCFYCCFNEVGYPGSVFGCFSGDNINEVSCRQFLIDDKECDEPLHVDLQEDCLCEETCEVPDWFEWIPQE
jgi:hypothetical protein